MGPTTFDAIAWDLNRLSIERSRLADWVRAPRTRAGYASDWRLFSAWCEQTGRPPLPASTETVALYLTHLLGQGRKVTTVTRHSTAIAHAHRTAGIDSPCDKRITALLSGAKRMLNERPMQKAPLTVDQLRNISEMMPENTAVAVRNRAVLVFGFASALRRSNIVALNFRDVEFTARGIVVQVWKEKQDQEGRGRRVGLPYGACVWTCPVLTLSAWLCYRGSVPGPLFTRIGQDGLPTVKRLHPGRVATILQHAVEKLHLDPRLYGAHSLRAGFVTAAGGAGVNELLIAAQTGHRSLESLKRYFRPLDPFDRGRNACSFVGL